MRAVVQRVTSSKVDIIEEENRYTKGAIKKGLMVLLGVTHEDTEEDVKYLSEKIVGLRIFEDEAGKMNLSLKDIAGEMLVVSQFTLYGDCRKGKRPSFTDAARPEKAIPLYEKFISEVNNFGIETAEGEFGAEMAVDIMNDGPVTLLLDSQKNF